MSHALTYDDIALIPQYFDGNSRSELETEVWLGNFGFQLPVMPANMKCVIDMELANQLQKDNYFYVMHRFDNDPIQLVTRMKDEDWNYSSISLGVKKEDYDIVDKLASLNLEPDFITVDIAHGHCLLMKNILSHIKNNLKNTFVIAGNVSTPYGYDDLSTWGADATKVGIGEGKSCITKLKTGFSSPMFSTVRDIYEKAYHGTPIIADGGIRNNGDIAKAIVAGASMVMAGSIFAQCTDSPAASINGEKVYFGSASAENKGHNRNVEGKQVILHNNGMTVKQKLEEITQDLQSAMSYAGGHLGIDTPYQIIH